MARTPLFADFRRIARVGAFAAAERLPAREAIARLQERAWLASRRDFLRGAAGAAILGATGVFGARRGLARSVGADKRVAIVGAGMAGLAAADRLESWGVVPVIYEANTRIGGRIRTQRDFDGLVGEAGGEMIDNLHKTMLGYANELGLELEDMGKAPGDKHYDMLGQLQSEADLVDEYCELVSQMRPDMQAISGGPTWDAHNDADVEIDNIDLATYLSTRGAGLPVVTGVLEQAYIAEYGLEASELSSLNMLLFLHLDCSAKFREYGVFSDERYHLVDGNDAIPQGIADRLSATVETGARLTAIRKTSEGKIALTFAGSATEEEFDAVIVTVPFSVLRGVTLDASLGISEVQQKAIDELGYGANCKTAIQFDGRPWAELHGGNGLVYSDRGVVQTTWESNYTRAGAKGLLTDYAGGDRGRELQTLGYTSAPCGTCHTTGIGNPVDDTHIQAQVEAFLSQLDEILPGTKAMASRNGDGSYVASRGHWLVQRYSKGSYTAYLPGQFTSICGAEGLSCGALKFAGEHTDSFYEWQGFMEGAANSGIARADEILDDIRAGRI